MQWFSTFSAHESSGGLVETQTELLPRISDSVGLGWGLRSCMSNKLPGDTDAAGLGITF